jgi:hypothetical protein
MSRDAIAWSSAYTPLIRSSRSVATWRPWASVVIAVLRARRVRGMKTGRLRTITEVCLT